ncbi:hypothetical protein TSUD_123220 [Trifolium subterraneum]|uniref:RNase H type-1 domain-containing protein n=1 Tax=Trifolium subterraneum TaxID=3900 RepID=A0A2Z6MH64_TRISU|nr:hypothetical protein TSUD_123220 [Trifolium subterraneum]
MWQSHNNKLWRKQTETTYAVYDRACTVLTEWQTAHAEQTNSINRQLQPAELKWSKPSLGRYKCNIDASFSSDIDKVGIGMCIRDDQGKFLLAKTEWFSPTCDVEMSEAQGLLHAFRWVCDLQLEDIDFELDAKIVVTKFHSKNDDISELGDVIRDLARDSWSAAGLSSVLHNATYQQTNVMDRICAICNNESSDIVGRVAMLLWCIWHNRNDKLWNDNVQMSRQIGRHAFDVWNDWYSVHKLQSNNVSGTTKADLVRWEKPALDWVKCNVDVAFVSGSGRTSMGLCFRDNNGHFKSGMTQ